MDNPNTTALIVTALPVEQKAVRSFLSNVTEIQHPHGTVYEVGEFFSGTGTLRVGVAEVGKGNPAAAMEVERAINFFSPAYAFFVGVAGGLKDVAIGDVVAADKVYGYEFGKDVDTFRPRPEFGQPHYDLLQKARSVARRGQWRTRIGRQNGSARTPEAYIGPIAAGEKVVAGHEARTAELLRASFSDALAVEMEGYGFLRAVYANSAKGLLVRGISDLLDRKAEADAAGSQVLASRHAAAFVFEVLANLDIAEDGARIAEPVRSDSDASVRQPIPHDQLMRDELDARFRDSDGVQKVGFEAYSRFFSTVCDFQLLPQAEHVFASLWTHVQQSEAVEAIHVAGYPGVGKSSFLQIFYWYVYLEHAAGLTDTVPIFINLHGYNTRPDAISTSLSRIRDYCRAYPDTSYVFILDGVEQYASHREEMLSEITAITNAIRHKKIVAHRVGTDDALKDAERRGETLFFDRVPVKSPQYRTCVDAFVQLHPLASAEQTSILAYILDSVQQCKLQEVDLFLLGLIMSRYLRPATQPVQSLIELLDQHVRVQLQNYDVPRGHVEAEVHKAAALAFKLHVQPREPEERETGERTESPLLYSIVHSHSRIADFLVARYIVLQLTSHFKAHGGKKTLDALRYVHPYRINSLCKEQLNRTVPIQQSALFTIRTILRAKSFDLYQKADACYLAGRFNNNVIQSQAKAELKRFFASIDVERTGFADEDEEKRHLLLVRSCYISLAYLGEQSELYTYIDHLLAKDKWDDFNRGFHLEYYGDQPYSASVGLLSSDVALKPFPLTFDQLSQRLLRRDENPLFELELQTLCSLAQHRHAAGLLDEVKQRALVDLLSELPNRQERRIGHSGLRAYVSVVLQHLRTPNFSIGQIALEFLNIKNIPREGWVFRGISPCESVADHTQGAMVLATLYLPDKPLDADPKYDKQKILLMLFVHDLIEAITGDILPWHKNEDVHDREKALYSAFRVYGTYDGVARVDWVDALWNEFEEGRSINALVARDIDKLDNLFQLSYYAGEHPEISGWDDFERRLTNQIETPYGAAILEIWREVYRGTRRPRRIQ